MAGMKFEYDENGATFAYFVLSFYAMIIIPLTYYFWPRTEAKKKENPEDLSCYEPCQKKMRLLSASAPKKRLFQTIIKLLLIVGWVVFFLLAYKVSQIEIEHKEYDPFAILGLDREATDKEIKKKYRELSKTMHPDKGGDADKFKELAKAYQALTDEETKKNWMEYGNPDGPGVTQFGIALPKWIVEGKNSYLVLGAYVFVFMFIMPIVVGSWWYKSIKYTGDQVLIQTTQIFNSLIIRNTQMNIKRVLMILSTAREYDRKANPEIVDRPSDNVEVPQLMRELPDYQEKVREQPYCYPYCVKARVLMYAHLARANLPENTLEKDKNAIIKKCPFLLNEMVNATSNLYGLVQSNYISPNYMPKLEAFENIMKLSPMIVQACWNKNRSNLLQLPHIDESYLRHFQTKKRNIFNIRQFVATDHEERRSILRNLSDEQYDDVMRVCSNYPYVEIDAKIQIIDDEDEHTVTAGALVTLVVNLRRQSLKALMNKSDIESLDSKNGMIDDLDEVSDLGAESNEVNEANEDKQPVKVSTHKPWEKQKKKSKQAKAKSKNSSANKNNNKSAAANKPKPAQQASGKEDVENLGAADNDNGEEDESDNPENETVEEEEEEKQPIVKQSVSKKPVSKQAAEDAGAGSDTKEDNDDYLEKFQQMQKKKEKLETKAKISHPVYCPFFPDNKQECWWLYVADKKKNVMICPPLFICTLKDEEEFELKMIAPKTPGVYTYSVILRSDSYLDFDVIQQIKLDVHEAKEVEDHKQWNFTDDEAEKNGEENGADDEYDTESEDEN